MNWQETNETIVVEMLDIMMDRMDLLAQEHMIIVEMRKVEYMNENINNGFKKELAKKRPCVLRVNVVDDGGYLLPMLLSIDIFERKLLLSWNREEVDLPI